MRKLSETYSIDMQIEVRQRTFFEAIKMLLALLTDFLSERFLLQRNLVQQALDEFISGIATPAFKPRAESVRKLRSKKKDFTINRKILFNEGGGNPFRSPASCGLPAGPAFIP